MIISSNPQSLQDYVKALEDALEPFANAYNRIVYYGGLSHGASLYACADDGYYELFSDEGENAGKEPKELLAVGHLANAAQIIEFGADMRKKPSWAETWEKFDEGQQP